jgi:ribosome biogenesis GTPase
VDSDVIFDADYIADLETASDENEELVRGLVTRKDRGRYMVQADGASVPCTISSMLRKKLIYPMRDPASLPHYEVQSVGDIEMVDPVAVGDYVAFVDAGDGTGMIKDVLPRKSQLSRLAAGPIPLEQVLVANVDQMVAVFAAARPKPKWHLLDRYLLTAEAAGVPAVICINKLDLVDPARLDPIIDLYSGLGYPVILSSAVDGRGLDVVREQLSGRISVLMGKSGVGKTSLLNALEPGLGLRVRAVGKGKVGKGRHTTTHLELVPLSSGGGVVDTPGMRELALWQARPHELPWLFPEFRPYLGTCKFGASCVHDSEPGCAIKQAVDNGDVSGPRYESYLKLLEEMSE